MWANSIFMGVAFLSGVLSRSEPMEFSACHWNISSWFIIAIYHVAMETKVAMHLIKIRHGI